MVGEKLPWFKFYPADFLTDEKVMTMTYEEIGIYLTLLCYQWMQGSIPADSSQAQAMLKLGSSHAGTDSEAKSFERVFTLGFHPHPHLENRLINNRLYLIQEEQRLRSQALSAAGVKGSQAKARLKPGFSQASASKSQSQNQNQREKKKENKRATPRENWWESFSITEALRVYCQGKGLPSPDDHVDAFLDHQRSTGGVMRGGRPVKDPEAAFRTWMRNTRTFGATKTIGVER